MTDNTQPKNNWRDLTREEWDAAIAKLREEGAAPPDEGILLRPAPPTDNSWGTDGWEDDGTFVSRDDGIDPFEKTVLDMLAKQKEFLNEQCMPKDPAVRKRYPVTTGFLDYFPMAVMEVANLSRIGNEQHNKGLPMHWSRGKSTDHADCLGRHLLCRGTFDTDGIRHSAKVAWRALALLQSELEEEVNKE